MTDFLLELIADYGLVILAGTIFLAALGVPVPATVLLVLCGAFAASGDMQVYSVVLTAFFSAVAGDFAGYSIGRKGGVWFQSRLQHSPFAKQIGKAELFVSKWGGHGVFLSRWLVAPIGPALNYVAGIGKFNWQRFVFWDVLGEVIWVGLYVSIGMIFSTSAIALAEMLASFSWVILGTLGMVLMGHRLIKVAKHAGKARA